MERSYDINRERRGSETPTANAVDDDHEHGELSATPLTQADTIEDWREIVMRIYRRSLDLRKK